MLKRKLASEGVLRELKMRRHYEAERQRRKKRGGSPSPQARQDGRGAAEVAPRLPFTGPSRESIASVPCARRSACCIRRSPSSSFLEPLRSNSDSLPAVSATEERQSSVSRVDHPAERWSSGSAASSTFFPLFMPSPPAGSDRGGERQRRWPRLDQEGGEGVWPEAVHRMMDLTTLEGKDTPGKVRVQQGAHAARERYSRAAICGIRTSSPWRSARSRARGEGRQRGHRVPSGHHRSTSLEDVRRAVEFGADEITVIDRGAMLAGDYAKVHDEIAQTKRPAARRT